MTKTTKKTKIQRSVNQDTAAKAMRSMDMKTFYERVMKQTVAFPERITVIESYAMSKAMHEKHLNSMSEVSHLMRHGTYNIDSVIERFDSRDWEAIARGDTKYTPKS